MSLVVHNITSVNQKSGTILNDIDLCVKWKWHGVAKTCVMVRYMGEMAAKEFGIIMVNIKCAVALFVLFVLVVGFFSLFLLRWVV